jgi:hypothetical protein
MKVRIVQTVSIDATAWALTYGMEQADVREDVISFCENAVREQLAAVGFAQPGYEA